MQRDRSRDHEAAGEIDIASTCERNLAIFRLPSERVLVDCPAERRAPFDLKLKQPRMLLLAMRLEEPDAPRQSRRR